MKDFYKLLFPFFCVFCFINSSAFSKESIKEFSTTGKFGSINNNVQIISDLQNTGNSDEQFMNFFDEKGNQIFSKQDIPRDSIETDAMQERFMTGFTAGDELGNSVSSAGDVNGDGYDDIIAGAPLNDAGGTDAGRAYIYFGGSVFNPVPDVILTGDSTLAYFGYSVSDAGDLNGDGFDDVIVGAYRAGSYRGKSYIFFGGANMNNTVDLTLTGELTSSNFGYSVSSAGDVNGDGYSDIIVGSQQYSSGTGRAYIYFGGASMNNTADVIMTGDATFYYFGISVSSAGDVNGDGYSDVIAGSIGYSSGRGKASIYFGGASMNNVADVTVNGAAANYFLGISVSSAGDVNGDGYSDVIVGAYGSSSFTGTAYIYFGGANMNIFADVTMTGENSNDNFGVSVSSAGDINADGYDDIIIGAHGFNSETGNAYVFKGGASMDNIPDKILGGESTNNQFGYSVSNAGDVNADGISDFVVGAPINDFSATDAGRAYLYLNSMTGTDAEDIKFNGEASNNYFGYSVSSAGDVNGDGYPDIIAGAYGNNKAYIFFGGTTINNVADVTLTGSNDQFGISVAGAGDVNGDGYSDVIVGQNFYNSNIGRAIIYFGGASMNTVADVTMQGEAIDNQFGISVASAGDVNGDGYSDVIVGAQGYSTDRGRAYIFYGGASMNSNSDITLTGETTGNLFGISVASAGDLNSDGYSDVIVGADGYSTNTGRAYVYYGGAAMNNTADVVMTGETTDNKFGVSVSAAGDVNRDGYSDVIVGADGYSSNTGRAYIYYGGASVNNTADIILTGESINHYFGISVAAAGDVNADTFGDVIVGANSNTSNPGAAYVFFGNADMNNSADITMTGENNNSDFGISVASAGDMNRDGYSDVIAGSDEYNSNRGRVYLFLSSSPLVNPRIISVKDIPLDQGGKVKLKWARSGYDVNNVNLITGYLVEVSPPPGTTGYDWTSAATVPAVNSQYYNVNVNTDNDSLTGNNGVYYFRIKALTNLPNQNWTSNILSGYSVDNLSPNQPVNLAAAPDINSVYLTWNQNLETDLHHYIIYRNGIVLNTSLNNYFDDSSVTEDSVYDYRVAAVDIHGNISPLSNLVHVTFNNFGQLNLTLIMEGFYDSSAGNMRLSDTVTVYFRNASAPYLIIDSSRSVINANTFTGSFLIKNAPTGNYFIAVKHRNTIETWSASAAAYVSGGNVSYSFTSASTQAFGSNIILVNNSPVRYAIYSGDVNQDGTVDLTDLSLIDNDAYNFVTGYVNTDLTGDNFVDLDDLTIADNNAFNFVAKVTP